MKDLLLNNKMILFLLLFQLNTILSQDRIIANGDSWYYYDNDDLDESWMTHPEKYNWKKGTTPIGYGDSKIITEISFGGDTDNKHIAKYFKKSITTSKNKYLAYEFRTLSDDGIVVYVNGKELFRINMPNSFINNKTLAIKTIEKDEEDKYKINIIDNKFFKEGENIITASVHQAYSDSSDCIFSLELVGHTSPEMLSIVLKDKDDTNKNLELKIKDLNTKFEHEKIIFHNESLENLNFNLKISFAIVSLLLMLSLIGYYFIFENFKKRSNTKNKKLKTLSAEILEKEKEMISISTNLLHNKQYFKEIKADLKGIRTEDKGTIKNIILEINSVLESEKDWGILKKHFNAVNDGFYDSLLKLHPELSETEVRHCMFIKLHLQTKEIAKILLIDPRSVQTSRYRIKKKMNLTEEQDMRDYLLNI
jgi:hypothetical protein